MEDPWARHMEDPWARPKADAWARPLGGSRMTHGPGLEIGRNPYGRPMGLYYELMGDPWAGTINISNPWAIHGQSIGDPWVTRHGLVAHRLPTGCPWVAYLLLMGRVWVSHWLTVVAHGPPIVFHGFIALTHESPIGARGSPMCFKLWSMGCQWESHETPVGIPWDTHTMSRKGAQKYPLKVPVLCVAAGGRQPALTQPPVYLSRAFLVCLHRITIYYFQAIVAKPQDTVALYLAAVDDNVPRRTSR